MTYSIETYKQDKLALDTAKNELSKLVVGEPSWMPSLYVGEYTRIAQYFGDNKKFIDTPKGLVQVGETIRRVARMFKTICTSPRISGFDCNIYAALLDEVEKKVKSKRKFFRRAKIKCLFPKSHGQPCYCARLRAIEAAALVAMSPVEPDMKEELNAKIMGALILDKEFKNESI